MTLISRLKSYLHYFYDLFHIPHYSSYVKGLLAERRAIHFMSKKGYKLVSKRYKTKVGEIDLILYQRKVDMLVFCEIKYRHQIYQHDNLITKKQWKRIIAASKIFMQRHSKFSSSAMSRFDAIIFSSKLTTPIHIENVTMYDNLTRYDKSFC